MVKKPNRKKKLLGGISKKLKGKKLGSLKKKKNSNKIDPLWKLEDGITNSIMNKFLSCPHRFYLSQVQGWKPKTFPYHLEFGNVFHLMTEAQDKGVETGLFEKIANNYVNKKIEKIAANGDQIRELHMLAKVATYTFIEYQKYWEENYSLDHKAKEWYERDFRYFDKEHAFDFKYRMQNGREVRLRGKIDGIFDLGDIESTTVLETKTKGRIDELAIEKGLAKDAQTGLYMLATKKIRKNTTPRGVLYNVVRRCQLRPRKNEPVKDFAERVRADIQSRPGFYFMRWDRTIADKDLEYFRIKMLEPVLHKICTWWDSVKKNLDDPFTLKCESCEGKIEFCPECNGTGEKVNYEHFLRPFNSFDTMSNAKGEFFEIVTDGEYGSYERKEFAFPELSVEDDLDQYLVGI